MRDSIYLIDLPTFPKGVVSLSFPAIAACLPPEYKIQYVDLNLDNFSPEQLIPIIEKRCLFAGIKVSCQNINYALKVTRLLKEYDLALPIVWGGEYPTLLPDLASAYADIIVLGSFENVSDELVHDIKSSTFKKIYDSENNYKCSEIKNPNYSIIKNTGSYLKTMGTPIETSRGCDKKCTFCMVHTMQPTSNFKTPEQLKNEILKLKGQFVNVVDYNLGVNSEHLDQVIKVFTESETVGWMAEMCLESLDDETLLKKLSDSGCRIIYCGLETTYEPSLKSINKANTNHIYNYRRIIKKVQSFGIQIAAGIIIGMEGADAKTIHETFKFYSEMGLIYAKITFLTYNPGTKVFESMKRVGTYVTEDPQFFDGNHFTFVPHGVNKEEVIAALTANIKQFYSLSFILKRARNSGLKGIAYWEFVNFNLVYRDAYLKWLKHKVFQDEGGFKKLLELPFKKSLLISLAEKLTQRIRKKRQLLHV